jgi:signal transduction histidine kinase
VKGLAVLGALSLLGSYGEWLLEKGRESKDEEVERLRNLGEINHLLLELHAKAASVPAALSLKSAVATLASRLRKLLEPDVVALVLSDRISDQGGGRWEVILAEGVELPDVLKEGVLAPALREAASSVGPVCRSRLGHGEGVALEAWSGLYVPLWARDSLVGLLAVERVTAGQPFGSADLDMVDSVARHAGLAIDNARLFRRLRALGAEEERVRIARELHDRVGQSLAYLALSLDSLQGEAGLSGAPGSRRMSAELGQLATEARRVVRQLRTKLSDLRTEVTDEHGLADAVGGLLERAEERSGISAKLSSGPLAPLPPEVGREVARVAEEAVNNAERHSGATELQVQLVWDGRGGELVVADNGRGLPASSSLRPDAFGILGMRERAEAIGGKVAISSSAGRGTTVTLRWGTWEDRG